eukprot:CCRYP_017782-RA/>CCRYP_017782-RA protein AED:0.41 eAED:0.41 QI:0/0/0/1/0/0/2/0/87
MLLEVNRLNKPWDGISVPTSSWDGDMGQLEHDDVPASFNRLLSPADVRNYDSTSLEDYIVEGEIRVLRNLPMAYFRGKLIDHFDIMW